MKKRNKFMPLMILLSIMTLSCSSQEIKRIDIKYVDIEIETPFQIKCDNFDSFFQNEIDSVSLNDNKSISEFINALEKLNKADLSKYSMPDTRIKIKIVCYDKISELCIDRFVISKQDSIFILSESFKSLLKKYTVVK